jgi:5S rRNA maturation endonuclease (ribonuclease M5)
LQNNKSLVEKSEQLAENDNVMLLLDTDPASQKLTKQMQNPLQAQGVKINTKLGQLLLRPKT